MLKRLVIGLAVIAMGASLAIADDGHKNGDGHDHDHEQAHKHEPKHNGMLAHSGHHRLELVAVGGTIELYVTQEDGSKEDINGAKATATVLADGKTASVTLSPVGENALKGSGDFNAGKGTTVVINLTLPGHEPEQTRFKLD